MTMEEFLERRKQCPGWNPEVFEDEMEDASGEDLSPENAPEIEPDADSEETEGQTHSKKFSDGISNPMDEIFAESFKSTGDFIKGVDRSFSTWAKSLQKYLLSDEFIQEESFEGKLDEIYKFKEEIQSQVAAKIPAIQSSIHSFAISLANLKNSHTPIL